MWFSTHSNWYEGCALKTPSHNNALESHNLVIKKEETFRERMPLSRFLQQCIESVEKWSKQYDSNDNQIQTVKEMRWNTFEQFKKRASIVWIVDIPNDGNTAEKWKGGKCTCPCYLNNIFASI